MTREYERPQHKLFYRIVPIQKGKWGIQYKVGVATKEWGTLYDDPHFETVQQAKAHIDKLIAWEEHMKQEPVYYP